MKEIEIISYEDRYHEDMKKLSLEWLVKYNLLEPEDEKVINNPKTLILDKGGYIYFARYKDEIIGTASLIKADENTFELAKLAVSEKYRGLNIGKQLIEKCLSKAAEIGAEKMILCTNHQLTSAIQLYKKYNFKEVHTSRFSKYVTADLEMELILAEV